MVHIYSIVFIRVSFPLIYWHYYRVFINRSNFITRRRVVISVVVLKEMTGRQILPEASVAKSWFKYSFIKFFPASLQVCIVTIGDEGSTGGKGRSRATGTRLAKSFGKRYGLFALYLTVIVNPNSVRGERAKA